MVGGGTTNKTWWAFGEGGGAHTDYPLGGWRPGHPSTRAGNESVVFVDWYYRKLAAFQDCMVNASLTHFPGSWLAVLYPGSSPRIQPPTTTPP